MRKFVIALCPANKIYLASVDPVFREGMNLGQATVGVPTLATQFLTFDAAMEIAKSIKGWGGAQRVEEIEIEVPPAVTVTAERIEALLDRTDLCSYTTPLTTEQRAAARAQIIDAINLLLYHNLDSIASAALLDARNA